MSKKYNKKNHKSLLKKRGQVWTADFIIGMLLFMLMLFISIKIIFSIYPSTEDTVVYRDAVHLSDGLLGEGYPANWENDPNSVVMPGIAENNRINQNKLSKFEKIDYYRAKTLMHITSDYVFFIRNGTTVINTGQCIYGYNLSVDSNCMPILTSEHYDTLSRIDRVVIYNSTVTMLTIYTWN